MRALKESVTSDKNQDGRWLKRVGVGVGVEVGIGARVRLRVRVVVVVVVSL